jgi:ribonuclease HII
MSIKQIEEQLESIGEDCHPFLQKIKDDKRKGVQNLILKWQRQQDKEKNLRNKFDEMNLYERQYRKQGFQLIAGIDEVGRGPLAGPVVAAAVILPENFFLAGIDDSKKLSEKKREEFEELIQKEAIAIGIAMIQPAEIDEINIYESTKKAMMAAISCLEPKPDFLLIDAMKLTTPYSSESIIKGDAKSVSIAAASIVAKVARDRLMKELSKSYPLFGFEQHMGYGTKEHIRAIQQYGITPHHRKSFAPIKDSISIEWKTGLDGKEGEKMA